MFEGRDPSCEIVNEVNRAFVFETGPIRPLIDFLQSEQAGKSLSFKKSGTKNSICLNVQSPKTLPLLCLQMLWLSW